MTSRHDRTYQPLCLRQMTDFNEETDTHVTIIEQVLCPCEFARLIGCEYGKKQNRFLLNYETNNQPAGNGDSTDGG